MYRRKESEANQVIESDGDIYVPIQTRRPQSVPSDGTSAIMLMIYRNGLRKSPFCYSKFFFRNMSERDNSFVYLPYDGR